MSAPARRDAAAKTPQAAVHSDPHDLWQQATRIRQEWLDHALSTQPADRATAERSLTALYARTARPRPRFVWVESPAAARPLVTGWPTLDQLYEQVRDPRPRRTPPLASDLAMIASRLRGALGAGVTHPDPELSPGRTGRTRQPWPELAPSRALDSGVPLAVVLHQGIRTALHRSLAHGFYLPVRAALAGGAAVPVCWYGQQDASWIAYYDVLRRLGLAGYGPDETEHVDAWADLARSCGWWWPGEDVCVVVDRPREVRTEPVVATVHDQIRLLPRGVCYRDGWQPLLSR
ncbi:DUF6745 domain-containing protein [Micromonospora sp. RL09-050-HVF-A]|uniref:DUF6745 domain-containing protein n=1 Tax=Micromonospora sp. RL09-050-HVF-A TaxID=1703433 RepID=UPI001C606976|nr:hypothetical protein [Micromonospora sp. RL09-050-HVF-A]MBW4701982.1 hypothetical protein [Micromonospora sp. RL09-050-HVF-A]